MIPAELRWRWWVSRKRRLFAERARRWPIVVGRRRLVVETVRRVLFLRLVLLFHMLELLLLALISEPFLVFGEYRG